MTNIKRYLKKITSNIGAVEVCDDKIICYVKEEKLKKFIVKDAVFEPVYELFLCGKDRVSYDKQKKYNINKPIYYIFDNIHYDKTIRLKTSKDDHLIFKNCIFRTEIALKNIPSITFENNKYFGHGKVNNCFISGKANNIKIINDNFIVQYSNLYGDCMKYNIDNLEIINSNVKFNSIEMPIKINSSNIYLENSKFENDDVISICSNTINLIDSEIVSPKEINIENENNKNTNNALIGINAPNIIYNGIDITQKEKKDKKKLLTILVSQLKQIETNVRNSEKYVLRQKLIYLLNAIKNECIHINNEEIIKLTDELNNKSINKILKK